MPRSPTFYLAQVNIAKARFLLHDERMAGFVDQLGTINKLADAAPGFVWRLQDESGSATGFRPYDDSRIIINLSVWESVEALFDFVYKTDHSEVLRRRHDWFEKPRTPHMALWWTPADHHPSVLDGRARLRHLSDYGPSGSAFTFKTRFPMPLARM